MFIYIILPDDIWNHKLKETAMNQEGWQAGRQAGTRSMLQTTQHCQVSFS
jgi:hypothetical protein